MRTTRWIQLRRRSSASLGLVLLVAASLTYRASAQSLRGSRASLDVQTAEAADHDFSYAVEPDEVRTLVLSGFLIPMHGNRDYRLENVSFPFARPAVKLFVERLASQYRRACGQPLVVTSLTRPQSAQPHNASEQSVHPTGMALDLRRPSGRCRRWLEETLLSLESESVLEATAERRPPHYHVAVFPEKYQAYVDELARPEDSTPPPASVVYIVRPGDSLWEIARSHGTSSRMLQRTNQLSSSRIHPGQQLRVPIQPR
ncbi:MAG: DUF5715 family protein [Acidobacteria bacterium]|nr:DUF5715 family protein [Acidobacteriota bacterium]